MKRYEIYLSEALEENLEDYFDLAGITAFSKISPVAGRGKSTPMLNTPVWPGRNTLYIVYTDSCIDLESCVTKLRSDFPHEGIALFSSDSSSL